MPSDSLFGAICDAMQQLGWLSEWLAEGARTTRLSSLFPAHNDIFYAPVPEVLRPDTLLRRVRLEAVRFAPLNAIQALASRKFDENRWVLDLPSGCLQPADRANAGGPYRPMERQRAAVDRLTGAASATTATEGIEFAPNAGLWTLFVFANTSMAEVWSTRIKAAFRLLADHGIGGWRGAGWGRSRRPRFKDGELGRLLSVAGWNSIDAAPIGRWWTFGLFSPSESDDIAWDGGAYRTLARGGWTAGTVQKPNLRLVREGSILACTAEPAGQISESELPGIPYPVIRYAAGLTLPWPEEA